MKNLNIKTVCIVLIIAIALSIAGCVSVEPTVTGLTGSSAATNPGGDTGGVDPGTTQPADPGSDGPSKPVDPTTPSEPAPSVPVDPSTPSGTDDPAHEHEYAAVMTKATCLEAGYTTYTCDCGDTYVGDRIEATGHQWSDWVVTKEPTVDETGEAVSVCAWCENTQSKTIGKIIPNHTHSYSEKVTKKATCSAEGVMTLTCGCGDKYTKAIAKKAHNYSKKETWPTCYAQGYMTYTCRDCGYSYKGDYKAKVDHSYCWEDVAPTCTEDGYTLFMCDYCLIYYYEDITPATGHSFDNYKPNGDATCSKDGTKTATCSNACGAKDTVTDVGSALGHNYTVTKVKEPTMKQDGYTTYTCERCGDSYKDDYVDKIPQEEFEQMVAEATLKYINQFRQEQGDTVATTLPVLTLIAQERAVQLQYDFRHDSAALRQLYNQYQYGEWVDGSPWGGSQYYNGNAMEAIIDGGGGVSDADALGQRFAEVLRNSSGHWSYVGSSEYPYIAIGATWSQNGWCICVLQTAKNYG